MSAESIFGKHTSDEEKAMLKGIVERQPDVDDSDIDYSDIPPLTDEQLARAIRGKFLYGTEPRFPVFLDPAVLKALIKIAARKQTTINDLVNDVLKKDLAAVEALL